MFYTKEVELWSKGDKEDLGGGVFTDGQPSLLRKLKVDLQPYSSAEAKMDYGFDTVTTHTLFTSDKDLKIGSNFIRYKGDSYHIKEIVTWDSYVEALLEMVR